MLTSFDFEKKNPDLLSHFEAIESDRFKIVSYEKKNPFLLSKWLIFWICRGIVTPIMDDVCKVVSFLLK